MLISRMLKDAKGTLLSAENMALVCAEQADFNGKVVASWAAMQLLEPGNLGAPITLYLASEGSPEQPMLVQVWLEGSTSAIPLAQR